MNIINLYLISGKIFKTISYTDSNNLKNILNNILEDYNCDKYIQLILNGLIINEGTKKNFYNFYIIYNLDIEFKNNNIIQVIFISKQSMF